MQTTAIANYHITSPNEQAFHIDADGVVGEIKSPVLEANEVKLYDLRDGDVKVSFAKDSIGFVRQETAVAEFNDTNDWKETYNQELSTLLVEEIGAQEVIVFDHTVRIDDQNSTRKPARNVHGDYSAVGAKQRLEDLLGADKAAKWGKGHYAFINTWRPIKHAITTAPLGFVKPASVAKEDWVDIALIYPDRRGQIVGLVHNPSHEWVYLSEMTPQEIAFFNVYDNQGKPYIAHSALDLVEDVPVQSPRMSVESRILVRY